MKRPAGCRISDTDLLAYRDEELSPARAATLRGHVAACAACQARLAAAAQISRTLQTSRPPRAPVVARGELWAAIAGQRGRWWPRLLPPRATLPALLIAAVIVMLGVRWWTLDQACPECAPAPAGPRITQTAGLPLRFAAPALLCPAFGPAVKTAPHSGGTAAASAPKARSERLLQVAPHQPSASQRTLTGPPDGIPRPAPVTTRVGCAPLAPAAPQMLQAAPGGPPGG